MRKLFGLLIVMMVPWRPAMPPHPSTASNKGLSRRAAARGGMQMPRRRPGRSISRRSPRPTRAAENAGRGHER